MNLVLIVQKPFFFSGLYLTGINPPGTYMAEHSMVWPASHTAPGGPACAREVERVEANAHETPDHRGSPRLTEKWF